MAWTSIKNRLDYLRLVYWEKVQADLSKILISDKKNGKTLSVKVMSISDTTRDKYLNLYVTYTKKLYHKKLLISLDLEEH